MEDPVKTGRRICRETGKGRRVKGAGRNGISGARRGAAHHPCRPARQEGAAPQPVTEGHQERGGGQGAVGTADGIRTGRAQGPDQRHPG